MTNAKDNLTDIITRSQSCLLLVHVNCMWVFYRLNASSDPVVQYFEPRVLCQVCGEEGHSQISCAFGVSKVAENFSYGDVVFYTYIDEEWRPDCLK